MTPVVDQIEPPRTKSEDVYVVRTDQGDQWYVAARFRDFVRLVGKGKVSMVMVEEVCEATEFVHPPEDPRGYLYTPSWYIKRLGYYVPTGRKIAVACAHIVSITRLAPRLEL